MQTYSSKKYRKSNQAKPVFSETGRVIGKVEQGTFKKTVQGSKHFLHTPPAIGFDVYALEQAQQAGAVMVQVYDKETRITYRASMQQVWELGVKLNRGYGRQIALPLSLWEKYPSGQRSQESLFK